MPTAEERDGENEKVKCCHLPRWMCWCWLIADPRGGNIVYIAWQQVLDNEIDGEEGRCNARGTVRSCRGARMKTKKPEQIRKDTVSSRSDHFSFFATKPTEHHTEHRTKSLC